MAKHIERASEHSRSLKGMLADYVWHPLSEEDWPKVRAETWGQASVEDWTKEEAKAKAGRS